MEEIIQKQHPSRILVVGPPQSGKTTIIESIKNSTKFPTDCKPTEGISISNHENYQFWEFGGIQPTHPLFLSNNCQFILVFDLSKLDKTVQSVEEVGFYGQYWLYQLKNYSRNSSTFPPIIIIATHCDKVDGYIFAILRNKLIENIQKILKELNLNIIEKIFPYSNYGTLSTYINPITEQIKINNEKFTLKYQGINKIENKINKRALQLTLINYNLQKYSQSKYFMWFNEFRNIFLNSFHENMQSIIIQLLIDFGNIILLQTKTFTEDIIILHPFRFLKNLKIFFNSIFSYSLSPLHEIEINIHNIWNKMNIQSINYDYKNIQHFFEILNFLKPIFNDKFCIPSMIQNKHNLIAKKRMRTNTHSFIDKIKLQYGNNEENYFFIKKQYFFHPFIPIGFIEQVILNILQCSFIKMDKLSSANDYCFNYENYFILLKIEEDKKNIHQLSNNCLEIIFYSPIKYNLNFQLFISQYIFNIPFELIHSSFFNFITIKQHSLHTKSFSIDNENDLNSIIKNYNHVDPNYYSIYLPDGLNIFDSEISKVKLKKFEFSLQNSFIWSGSIQLRNKHFRDVLFQEFIDYNENTCRIIIHHTNLIKLLENQFSLRFLGICNVSISLLESRETIELGNSTNTIGKHEIPSTKVYDSSTYVKNQFFLVFEETNWGCLCDNYDILISKSIKLKLKFALDIIRAIKAVYFDNYNFRLAHREISSRNIFIHSFDENFEDVNFAHIKIGDFNSVIIPNALYYQTSQNNYRYLPPEALTDKFVLIYSDVYSFGILLWEILVCCAPFSEFNDFYSFLQHVTSGEKLPVDNLSDDVPNEILQLLNQCWNIVPTERPNFDEIIEILTDSMHKR